MKGAVTAIYRSLSVANQVRDELEHVGIGREWITVLPSTRIVPDTTNPSRSTTLEQDSLRDAIDQLHDLHLPEDDTRTYQQALRQGSYVVSAAVEEDADIGRIEEIMRRPQDAHDLDELGTLYLGADYMARRQPPAEGFDEQMVGRRDDNQRSPYTRTYQRNAPLLVPPIALLGMGPR